jgi:CsoR family transcriptional regulator, copper-sensing transcriptional repressor
MTEQQVGQAHGYIKEGDKEKIRARLRRIEGQVRGVQRMIDKEKYCVDILTQISSYIRASEKVALLVLRDHMDHCVREHSRMGRTPMRKSGSCRRLWSAS